MITSRTGARFEGRGLRIVLLGCALLAGALLAAGCGGAGTGQVEEPSEPDEEPRRVSDDMIPPEKLDQIRAFFDRKRPIMSRCFVDAVDAGEVPRSSGGRVTITMTITPEGALTKLEAVVVEPPSATLQRCVLETAARWTVTPLPKALDYSHSYGFGTL